MTGLRKDALIQDSSYYSLETSYARVNRYFTVIVFITSIIGASADTIAYYANQLHFLFIINLILIVLLLLDLTFLLYRKLSIQHAFTILLYLTLLNITITHLHEFNYANFLAKAILMGFWGILFVVLSGLVLGGWHPYLVMVWAVTMLILDIIRTDNDFLKETIPIIIITLIGLSYGVHKFMQLLRHSFQKNQDALSAISKQKNHIEKQAQELEVSNADLSELQNLQKDLVEMIVHDMKNPLSNILINSTKVPSKSEIRYVHEAGRQMLLLVENMLDVQRMDSTNLPMKMEAVHISNAVYGAMDQVELLIKQYNVKIEIDVDEGLFVKSDRDILIRILVNLFTNALKNSPDDSCIKVSSWHKQKGSVTLSIKDHGKGIPEVYREKIFDKFVQVISLKSGSARATGLGLAFCKLSIESMLGEIWVEDSSSKGTNICFSLPRAEDSQSLEKRETKQRVPFILTDEEKQALRPVAVELQQLDLYKAGLIYQELARLPDGNEMIGMWEEDVKNAVFSVNHKKFQHLLEMVLSAV